MATSDIPQIDLEATLAQLARDREETRKFTAESHKLWREGEKFRAEEQKMWREWRMAPWLAWLGIAGGIITLIGAALRAFGH